MHKGFPLAAPAAVSGQTADQQKRSRQRSLRGALAAALLVGMAGLWLSCGGGNGKGTTHVPDHLAYVTLPTRGSVLLLNISGATGAITPGAQTPQVAGTSPTALALLPNKKFLYVANADVHSISTFSVAGDGTLSLVGTPTNAGNSPADSVIDPSGKYLLVTNNADSTISVFSIDSSTGALTEVAGSPFYANKYPGDILMTPSGNYVYVTNSPLGAVSAFAFDAGSGNLTQIPGSPFFSGGGASGMTLDITGTYLYVANSIVSNPNGSTGTISGFSINSATGALAQIAGSPFLSNVGSLPRSLVTPQSGRFIFAVTPGTSYSLWVFSINPQTGQLTAESNSPYSVTGGGNFALIDTSGNYLYIGSTDSNGVAGYTYDNNTGQPTAITNSPFSTGVAPGKMVISH